MLLLTDCCQLSLGHLSLNPLLFQEKLLHLICILLIIVIYAPIFPNGITSLRIIQIFNDHSREHLTATKLFIERYLRKKREYDFSGPMSSIYIFNLLQRLPNQTIFFTNIIESLIGWPWVQSWKCNLKIHQVDTELSALKTEYAHALSIHVRVTQVVSSKILAEDP